MPGLSILSVVLISVGVGILWKQSWAKHCPAHNRIAGIIAIGLALLSLFAGVALLIVAALVLAAQANS